VESTCLVSECQEAVSFSFTAAILNENPVHPPPMTSRMYSGGIASRADIRHIAQIIGKAVEWSRLWVLCLDRGPSSG